MVKKTPIERCFMLEQHGPSNCKQLLCSNPTSVGTQSQEEWPEQPGKAHMCELFLVRTLLTSEQPECRGSQSLDPMVADTSHPGSGLTPCSAKRARGAVRGQDSRRKGKLCPPTEQESSDLWLLPPVLCLSLYLMFSEHFFSPCSWSCWLEWKAIAVKLWPLQPWQRCSLQSGSAADLGGS